MSWITMSEIISNVYQISEPFQYLEPRYGLMDVHSYLVVGRERAALVDTGTGVEDLRQQVDEITDRPIITLNTHYHWDHTGSNARFSERGIHRLEAGLVNQPQETGLDPAYMKKHGLLPYLPRAFQIESYLHRPVPATLMFRDMAQLDLGGRVLTCLHTPGHSPGHTAFWLEKEGLLFSGDAAYRGPLFTCYQGGDAEAFARSARRLAELPEPGRICPGHGPIIQDPGWLDHLAACADRALDAASVRDQRGFIPGGEVPFEDLSIWLSPPGDPFGLERN